MAVSVCVHAHVRACMSPLLCTQLWLYTSLGISLVSMTLAWSLISPDLWSLGWTAPGGPWDGNWLSVNSSHAQALWQQHNLLETHTWHCSSFKAQSPCCPPSSALLTPTGQMSCGVLVHSSCSLNVKKPTKFFKAIIFQFKKYFFKRLISAPPQKKEGGEHGAQA